jgi:hypothetical protein
MKIDQGEEEDLLKTASVLNTKSGTAPPWCTQDWKIHIFEEDYKL